MAKRIQPRWKPFNNSNEPMLKLYNSLSRQKELFVPQNGRKVMWYSCGPTVYDASHMGHARSYITFDILRRIIANYFGYEVFYAMNITDIDDKIIQRARQNYLFDNYVNKNYSLEKILEDSKLVMDEFSQKVRKTTDTDKRAMLEKMLEKLIAATEELESVVKSDDNSRLELAKRNFLIQSKDAFSNWLDKMFGSNVTDNAIFSELPAYWESQFHKDMDALNIMRPNVLTRVSEYIPEIVDYVRKIIDNGMAYESNGSVYFDVEAFDSCEKHHYAKLIPEAYGDMNSLQEGEGDLSSVDQQQQEKRSPTDFALWKRSKAGEPSWPSPWGPGRPGWHIECSAMASAICGNTLDIHTGGIDLRFPHHDNEIAQSEAYFGSSEWVKYFLHSGHLTIAGCKMSKSLKNFISIEDALKSHTSRQLRFAFLLHSWKDTLDYSANVMEIAISYEKIFNEFFLNVKHETRSLTRNTVNSTFTKWDQYELDLRDKLTKYQVKVHSALCDNIDTRTALETMKDIISASNLYLRDRKPPNMILLREIAIFLTRMLRIFGAIGEEDQQFGFPVAGQTTENHEEIALPYLNILSTFRDNVRLQARILKANDILTNCDRLRDDILPNIGVRLEDREGEPSIVKIMDRDSLLREKEAKRISDEQKVAEKERKRRELIAAQETKEAQRKIPSSEMFKKEIDKYSKFDQNGLPTHDVEGKEISKGLLKKLQKLQQTQEKKYQEYLASLE